MRKHIELRAVLVEALPELVREKDLLAVWIDRGSIAARLGSVDQVGNKGFEYRYRVNVVMLDFADDPAVIFAVVIDWLRSAQPELLLNRDTLGEAIAFEVDPIDDRLVDIHLRIDLNEAVDIGPNRAIVYREEPPVDDQLIDVPLGTPLRTLSLNGEDLP